MFVKTSENRNSPQNTRTEIIMLKMRMSQAVTYILDVLQCFYFVEDVELCVLL